ncbi:uncharacterized protein JCM10292_004261 [Rhodotorula paludigena]|uniref:uncharacterized protein n=1 Tax=Rhodotorula paludigena TaxID=86838 RepID=UPI0031795E10
MLSLPTHEYVSLPDTPLSDHPTFDLAAKDVVVVVGDDTQEKRRRGSDGLPGDQVLLGAGLLTVHRRHARYFVVLIAASIVVVLCVLLAPPSRLSRSMSPFASASLSTPHAYHPTLVGPRPRFNPSGRPTYEACSTEELLAAIKGAKVRPDGASTQVDFSEVTETEVQPIEWSFDFPAAGEGAGKACPLPKVYSPEEACELLGAFGGVHMAGDSLVRHTYSALLMIVTGRVDPVVDAAATSDCRGDHFFDDGKACRERVAFDTNADYHVCGNAAQLRFIPVWQPLPGDVNGLWEDFPVWRSSRPKHSALYSPVLVSGFGAHGMYDAERLETDWWPALDDHLSRQYPTPLYLFQGPHAVAPNLREQFRELQGEKACRAYKEKVEAQALAHSPVGEPSLGGYRYVDMYGMSEGAQSYDGMHYSLQVNLEKAHLFLNLLDTLWGEIVRSGGMAVLRGDSS